MARRIRGIDLKKYLERREREEERRYEQNLENELNRMEDYDNIHDNTDYDNDYHGSLEHLLSYYQGPSEPKKTNKKRK